MTEETKEPVLRYWQVPEDRVAEGGMFIGGAWFPFVRGIVATPKEGDYSWALSGFVEVVGPHLPGGDAPAPVVATAEVPTVSADASATGN